MVSFFGSVVGKTGKVISRTGTWNHGVTTNNKTGYVGVRTESKRKNNHDTIEVYATNGSFGTGVDKLIATLRYDWQTGDILMCRGYDQWETVTNG